MQIANDARNKIAQERANELASSGMTGQQAWDYAVNTKAEQDKAASEFTAKAEYFKKIAAKKGQKLGD